MANEPSLLLFIAIGLGAGLLSGFFGIGGGIIIVPALIYIAEFSPLKATGTSLAVLLPPVGLAAVITYYRAGNIDIRAAVLIAIFLFIGAWASSLLANRVNPYAMKFSFGIFMVAMGLYMAASNWEKMVGK
ncbi:MAG TPA: sulfite exporter TauE/SafE family protein [Bacteroidota bacterium]|nr:sulfite exporter TauE/SafE family protein [Bacteroidota bacterium]